MIHYTDVCIFCGQCEEACIHDHLGIRLTTDWELSFFDRSNPCETIEKKLQLCEVCGEIVGCVDHLRWLAGRLGALAFSSPTLYLAHLDALGVIGRPLDATSTKGSRADRFRILCARCRRNAALAQGQW